MIQTINSPSSPEWNDYTMMDEKFNQHSPINLSVWDEVSNCPSLVSTDPDCSLTFSLSSGSDISIGGDEKNKVESPPPKSFNDISFVFDPSKLNSVEKDTSCLKKKTREISSWYDQIFNFFDTLCVSNDGPSCSTQPSPSPPNRKYKHRIQSNRQQMNRYQLLSQDFYHVHDSNAKKTQFMQRQARDKSRKLSPLLVGSKSMDEECVKDLFKSRQSPKSTLLESMNCMKPHTKKLVDFDESRDDQSEVCYDSDPGDFTYRRGKMRMKQSKENLSFSNVEDDLLCSSVVHDDKKIIQSQLESECSFLPNILAAEIVKKAMNKIETLKLHIPQEHNKPTRPPICVHTWIERGTLLEHKVIEPKLSWSVVNGAIQEPMSIPLMDIYRIFPVTNIDRIKYPFAKTKHSFYIRSASNGEFLFEALNEIEMNAIIRNLKFVIARLASQAFVNDSVIIQDYFRKPFDCRTKRSSKHRRKLI